MPPAKIYGSFLLCTRVCYVSPVIEHESFCSGILLKESCNAVHRKHWLCGKNAITTFDTATNVHVDNDLLILSKLMKEDKAERYMHLPHIFEHRGCTNNVFSLTKTRTESARGKFAIKFCRTLNRVWNEVNIERIESLKRRIISTMYRSFRECFYLIIYLKNRWIYLKIVEYIVEYILKIGSIPFPQFSGHIFLTFFYAPGALDYFYVVTYYKTIHNL